MAVATKQGFPVDREQGGLLFFTCLAEWKTVRQSGGMMGEEAVKV